jgi:hypothetical protein
MQAENGDFAVCVKKGALKKKLMYKTRHISCTKNPRITKTYPHKNALNLITYPLGLTTVGTLIHKEYR